MVLRASESDAKWQCLQAGNCVRADVVTRDDGKSRGFGIWCAGLHPLPCGLGALPSGRWGIVVPSIATHPYLLGTTPTSPRRVLAYWKPLAFALPLLSLLQHPCPSTRNDAAAQLRD
jgi:hypothetical protein